MKNLFVTHYKRTTPRGGWTPLAFYTQDADTKTYYLGFETFRSINFEDIQRESAHNLIKPLDKPVAINFEQALWITPDYNIYLASFNNPQKDKKAILLEKIDQIPGKEVLEEQLNKLKESYQLKNEGLYF